MGTANFYTRNASKIYKIENKDEENAEFSDHIHLIREDLREKFDKGIGAREWVYFQESIDNTVIQSNSQKIGISHYSTPVYLIEGELPVSSSALSRGDVDELNFRGEDIKAEALDFLESSPSIDFEVVAVLASGYNEGANLDWVIHYIDLAGESVELNINEIDEVVDNFLFYNDVSFLSDGDFAIKRTLSSALKSKIEDITTPLEDTYELHSDFAIGANKSIDVEKKNEDSLLPNFSVIRDISLETETDDTSFLVSYNSSFAETPEYDSFSLADVREILSNSNVSQEYFEWNVTPYLEKDEQKKISTLLFNENGKAITPSENKEVADTQVKVDESESFMYGMRSRPFGIGTYPKNDSFITAHEGEESPYDDGRKYYNVIEYSSPLSKEDVEHFQLDDYDYLSKGGERWENTVSSMDYLISHDKEDLFLEKSFYSNVKMTEDETFSLFSKNGYDDPYDAFNERKAIQSKNIKETIQKVNDKVQNTKAVASSSEKPKGGKL